MGKSLALASDSTYYRTRSVFGLMRRLVDVVKRAGMEFSFALETGRVTFGRGSRHRVRDVLGSAGLSRSIVLTTPEQACDGEELRAGLGDLCVGLLPVARMHTPVDVTLEAMSQVATLGADSLIALGGGSTIGLAKAIALRTDLPQIAVPTTYAGSEVTPVIGQTENGSKSTQRSSKVLPEYVIYDPELTLSLPAAASVNSGLNAIAHAAEALYAVDRNPVTSLMAEEGVASLVSGLRGIVANPGNLDARDQALMGAWLCGICLASTSMALHHKLCHVLGGSLALPHAETHAILLPYTFAFNAQVAPDAAAALTRALSRAGSWATLHDVAVQLGAPLALRDLGMAEHDIAVVAEQATASPYANPRAFTKDDLTDLLRCAWVGDPPSEK
jgi:alcohol dehydrogenase class IV